MWTYLALKAFVSAHGLVSNVPVSNVWTAGRTPDVSLSLLRSPLLQTATDPHGHHLGIPVVVLDYKGMVLQKQKQAGKQWLERTDRRLWERCKNFMS